MCFIWNFKIFQQSGSLKYPVPCLKFLLSTSNVRRYYGKSKQLLKNNIFIYLTISQHVNPGFVFSQSINKTYIFLFKIRMHGPSFAFCFDECEKIPIRYSLKIEGLLYNFLLCFFKDIIGKSSLESHLFSRFLTWVFDYCDLWLLWSLITFSCNFFSYTMFRKKHFSPIFNSNSLQLVSNVF